MAAAQDRAAKLRRHWNKQAPAYDKQLTFFDRHVFGDTRAWICGKATGRTWRSPSAPGLNLPHYPSGIQLTGIEQASAMLERRGWPARPRHPRRPRRAAERCHAPARQHLRQRSGVAASERPSRSTSCMPLC
jgi:hypothetical protein